MESFVKGILLFSQAYIIVPLLLYGLVSEISKEKKYPSGEVFIWRYACLLVLFSVILNTFLKSLFLVPLNPAIGVQGYAFPSGHMQVSFIFYGWLFLRYSHRALRLSIPFLLSAIFFGLIHEGYHSFVDNVGAIGVGICVLYIFNHIIRRPFIQKNPAYVGVCLIPICGLMMGVINYRVGISTYVQYIFGGLIAFAMIWWLHFQSCQKKLENE
ncbi:MAG: phosphatase PAP2 family protein [Alphaproteobacteria bacterium]|nr:phosphatase PAP2 family protein [Alphaproteobacteria bacterium]